MKDEWKYDVERLAVGGIASGMMTCGQGTVRAVAQPPVDKDDLIDKWVAASDLHARACYRDGWWGGFACALMVVVACVAGFLGGMWVVKVLAGGLL